jgi:hypothetical protein
MSLLLLHRTRFEEHALNMRWLMAAALLFGAKFWQVDLALPFIMTIIFAEDLSNATLALIF